MTHRGGSCVIQRAGRARALRAMFLNWGIALPEPSRHAAAQRGCITGSDPSGDGRGEIQRDSVAHRRFCLRIVCECARLQSACPDGSALRSALWSADVHSHVAACALTLHTGYTLTVGTMMIIRGCENNDCSYYFSPGRRRLAVRPSGAPARQSRERHQTKPKPIETNEKSSLCFTQSPHLIKGCSDRELAEGRAGERMCECVIGTKKMPPSTRWW